MSDGEIDVSGDYLALALSTLYFALHIEYRRRYLRKYHDVDRIAVLGVAMYLIIFLNVVFAVLIFFRLFSERIQFFGGAVYALAFVVFFKCHFWEIKRTHKSKHFDGRFRIS